MPTEYTPGPPTTITTKGLAYIRWIVESKPDIILVDICKKYIGRFKKTVSPSMVCRALKKMELRRKKKSIYAAEQERDDIKKNGKNFKK